MDQKNLTAAKKSCKKKDDQCRLNAPISSFVVASVREPRGVVDGRELYADVLAIEEALRDMANGDHGVPLDKFLADLSGSRKRTAAG